MPQASSSSPHSRAYARTDASTARQCRRSASLFVHSVRSAHAASRSCTRSGMAAAHYRAGRDAAGRQEPACSRSESGYPQTMAVATRDTTIETFLIEGGVPLSGTVRPAGNKNAALPILAACVLTADPVTLDNVPRIRDVEAMIELLVDIGVEVEWLGPNRLRVWAADVRKTAPRRRAVLAHPRVDPVRRPAARPLRHGRHPAAGRRRHRPPPRRHPPDGVRGAGRRRRGRPRATGCRAPVGPARGRHLPRRGVGDRHRERRHGGRAGARHDDHPKRRLRAARAGSVPPAVLDGRAIEGIGSNVLIDPRRRVAAAAPRTGSAPTTSRWRRSSAWPP